MAWSQMANIPGNQYAGRGGASGFPDSVRFATAGGAGLLWLLREKVYTNSGNEGADALFSYDSSSNIWTTRAAPGFTSADFSSRLNFGFVYCNGKLYVMGGTDSTSTSSSGPLTTCWAYTVGTPGSWAQVASMPTFNYVISAWAYGTDVMMLCSSNDDPFNSNYTLLKYSTTGNTWTTVSSSFPASTPIFSGQPLVSGVYTYIIAQANKIFRYNNSTNVWDVISNSALGSPVYEAALYARDALLILQTSGDSGSSYQVGRLKTAPKDVLESSGNTNWQSMGSYLTSVGLAATFSGISGTDGTNVYLLDVYGNNQNSYKNTLVIPALNSMSPSDGASIATDVPILQASIGTNGADKQNVHWQIAKDTGFTTQLRDIFDYEPDVNFGANKAYYVSGLASEKVGGYIPAYPGGPVTVRPGEELSQGTWYFRARSEIAGVYGPWSTTRSTTVTHPPSASLVSPSNNTTLDYGTNGSVTLTWGFNDTSETDFQTAYQVLIERNDTGATVVDTGKVSSQNARSITTVISAGLKDVQLRWKIRLYDSDDITGGYSSYGLFRVSDKPVVNITAPAEGGTVTTGKPTINWTFSGSGGRTQVKYRVRFLSGGTPVFDSGDVTSADTTFTPADQVLSGGAYVVEVTVLDSFGLSGVDTNAFTTSYAAPASPNFTVNNTFYPESGYILISWTNAAKDSDFYSWVVYRANLDGIADPSWVRLATFYTDQGNYSYKDYTAGSNTNYAYAVVQEANRFGTPVGSAKNGVTINGVSEYYWLIHPTNSALNFKLYSTKSESFEKEWERTVHELAGKGRKVDYGTLLGYKGSLEAQVRLRPDLSPRQARFKLEALRDSHDAIYLRNPFGDIILIDMESLSFSRVAGVGTMEFLDVSISYIEVAK